MGNCAELCAERYGISREQMDNHAVETFERAQAAAGSSRRDVEVVPVEIPASRGSPGRLLSEDESLSKMNPDKLRKLKPFFKQVGRGRKEGRGA